MPCNVEVKVRVADLVAIRGHVAALGAKRVATQDQVDRYYSLDGGRRVKLRTFAGAAQLIEYDRPETACVRTSDYRITPVRDAEAGVCLVPKGKPLVVVRKRREIYLLDNVRIHLDEVEDLGIFLELEAVVDTAHDEDCCRRQVEETLSRLLLADAQRLALSYSDMLGRRPGPAPAGPEIE